ncbi:MAG: FAD-binding oxidoreductase, partial [Pseudomonadota bacterium]
MPRFHDLTVTEIRKTTRDAVVVTLAPTNGAAETFDFVQGQYITFRRQIEGEEIRRSYSICAGRDDGILQVGIKRVEGGAFSTFANDVLRPGDVLEAMPPAGAFHTPLDPTRTRNYLGFAGGSGITPVLSILRTVLASEPHSTFSLVYANRGVSSIMFREDLEDLKNQYLDRFTIIHVLESNAQEIELFTGRIDGAKLDGLFRYWLDPASIDLAFICGPEPMMLTIADGLKRHGLTEQQIKFELFTAAQPGRLPQRVSDAATAAGSDVVRLEVRLDGAVHHIEMSRQESVLAALLGQSLDAPYACRAGV